MSEKPSLSEFAKAVLRQPIPAWQRAALDAMQNIDPKKLVIPRMGRRR